MMSHTMTLYEQDYLTAAAKFPTVKPLISPSTTRTASAFSLIVILACFFVVVTSI